MKVKLNLDVLSPIKRGRGTSILLPAQSPGEKAL